MHILNDKMTTKNEEPQTLSLQQSQISIAAKITIKPVLVMIKPVA